MGALRGAVSGGIGLSALYLVVTSKQQGLSTAANLPGKVLHWLIDPAVPLIPDRRPAGSSSSTPATPNFPNGNPDGVLPNRNSNGSIPGLTA